MRIKMSAIFSLALIVLAACGPKAVPQVGFASANQAWIDAPLPDSHLPLAPVEIVAHAANPDGIASFEIDLNGQLLAKTVPDPASIDQTLRYMRYSWQPAAPGRYLIEVKAFDRNNQPGLPAQVTVEVGEPTPTLTHTVTQSGLQFSPYLSGLELHYGGCTPDKLDFTVDISGPANAASVLLFVRLKDQASGKLSDWNGGFVMSPLGNGKFWFQLSSIKIPDYDKYPSAWLNYQFAALDTKGAVLARSDVYYNVVLTRCVTATRRPHTGP